MHIDLSNIMKLSKKLNLSCSRRSEGYHMCQCRDDVHGEADEERADGGIDWAEEWKDDC